MSDFKVAAVLRNGVFSPNHIANDAAILHAVAKQLRRRGVTVNVYTEREFCESEILEDAVMSMGRAPETLQKMKELEEDGMIVVNSGYGIENCVRMVRIPLFKDAGIEIPDTHIVETNVRIQKRLESERFRTCWVKRADTPSLHQEDVARCRHPEEAQEILHEFFFRGIRKAAVSRHVEGDVLKFYGVASSGWFHWFMPMFPADADRSHPLMSDDFAEKVRRICMRGAEILGIDVFGGDMVITPDARCLIVDVDDWPSFAPCREDAARAIAKSLMARLKPLNPKRKYHEIKKTHTNNG